MQAHAVNNRGVRGEAKAANALRPMAAHAAGKKAENAMVKDMAVIVADDQDNEQGAVGNFKRNDKNMKEVVVVDERMKRKRVADEKPKPEQPLYYRAREFAMVDYSKSQDSQLRTDFRSTIFWNPDVEIDKSGKKVIEFYASDEITSFRCIAEGVSVDGQLGRDEKTIYTQLPFSMSVKVPTEVVQQDFVEIPLTLKNNTQKILTGKLNVKPPVGFVALGNIPAEVSIEPSSAKTIYLKYNVASWLGVDSLRISFTAAGNSDPADKTFISGFFKIVFRDELLTGNSGSLAKSVSARGFPPTK